MPLSKLIILSSVFQKYLTNEYFFLWQGFSTSQLIKTTETKINISLVKLKTGD